MSGIFLSYRREDASGWAGRLYEHLVQDWGREQVFIDIDTIAPGEDFREAIERTMQMCDVVLVVIGPTWLDARDEAGNRRLDDERDTHRAEVRAALTADVRVVPVLVGGARMPRVSELPEPLKDLSYRNAAIVEDRRFAADVDVLQRALGQQVADAQGLSSPGPAQPDEAGGIVTWEVLLAAAGVFVAVGWGLVPARWHDESQWIVFLTTVAMAAGVGAGVWRRQWTWIVWAGITGLAGLVLWMLQLLSTHPEERHEIVGASYDGFVNAVALLGAAMVIAAGVAGGRRAARRDADR